MHKSKIAFLKRSAQNKILLSGVMRRSSKYIPMGLPVILAINDPDAINIPKTASKPIPKKYKIKSKKNFDDRMGEGLPGPYGGNRKAANITQSLSGTNRKKDTYVKDIIELSKTGKNITEINKLLRECSFIASLIVPFPQFPDNILTQTQIHAYDFFYNGKIPLIEDEGVVIESIITDQSKTPTVINNTAEVIEDCINTLKTNRFMNISISNLTNSTFSPISQDISKLFAALKNKFKYNSSCYRFGEGQCTLLDTISISFYSLSDMIQLFSTQSLQGVGIELTAFNSHESQRDKFVNNNYSTTVHMLFANESEGITNIDGENIERQYTGSVKEDLATFLNCVIHSVPLDITQQAVKNTNQKELF